MTYNIFVIFESGSHHHALHSNPRLRIRRQLRNCQFEFLPFLPFLFSVYLSIVQLREWGELSLGSSKYVQQSKRVNLLMKWNMIYFVSIYSFILLLSRKFILKVLIKILSVNKRLCSFQTSVGGTECLHSDIMYFPL